MNLSVRKWVIVIWLLFGGLRLPAQDSEVLWALSLGGRASEQLSDLAFDAKGNAWLMGNFTGVTTLDNQELESAGENDLFLVKLSAKWQVLWAEQAGGMRGEIFGRRLALDAAGNCFVGGYFTGRVTLGDTLLEAWGATDAFVAKYNPDGQVVWARRAGAPGIEREQVKDIAVDARGDVLVAGVFADSANFGNKPLALRNGANIFLAKYSNDGELIWVQALGGGTPGFDEPLSLAVDASNHICLTGDFALRGQFGRETVAGKGGLDGFLVQLLPDGQVSRATAFGGKGHDWGGGVRADSRGNLLLMGGFQGGMDIGGRQLQSQKGSFDVFVAKFDGQGNCLWAEQAGGKHTDTGMAIGVDAADHLLIAGHFQKEINFATATFTAAGERDIFVAAYNPAGALQWAHTFGGAGREEPRVLIPRDTLGAVLGGVFSGLLPLGSDTLKSNGATDIWLAGITRPAGWQLPLPAIAEEVSKKQNVTDENIPRPAAGKQPASPPVAMAGANPAAALTAGRPGKDAGAVSEPAVKTPTGPAAITPAAATPAANPDGRENVRHSENSSTAPRRKSAPGSNNQPAATASRVPATVPVTTAERFQPDDEAIRFQITHPFWGIALGGVVDAESESLEFHDLQDSSSVAENRLRDRFRYSVTADSTALRIEIVRESPRKKTETHKFALYRTYRNPFNQQNEIHYEIPGWETVQIEVFDLTGVKLRTLVKERQPAGYYRVVWDGKTDDGDPVANGVYEYRMNAGKFAAARKAMFIWR